MKRNRIFYAAVIAIGCILMFWAGTRGVNGLLISVPLLGILSVGICVFTKRGNVSKAVFLLPVAASLIFGALNCFASLAYNLDPTLVQPDGSYPVWGILQCFFNQTKMICLGAVLSAFLFVSALAERNGVYKQKHRK